MNNSPDNSASLKSKIFLSHALKIINAPLVVDERLELIARIIADYLNVDDVSIFLREQDSDNLVLRISIGLDSIALGKIRVPLGKGITGMVAKTRQYIATKNIMEDPRNFYSIYAEDEKYPSILSFPIIRENELIGTVNIRSKVERDFTEAEAEELNNFTASIAGSIKNAQAYENLEYKAKLLELSIKIASSISSSLDLDVILEEMAWEITKGFGIYGVLIHLLDGENVTKTASHGLRSSFVKNYPLKNILSCAKSDEPKIDRLESGKSIGIATEEIWNISLPLIGQKKTMGTITLLGSDDVIHDPGNRFLSTGVDVLLHISGLAALAIESAMIYSELKRLSEEEKNRLDVIESLYSRMSAIFDSIDNGIIAVDENGIIRDFNNIARKSLGLDDNARGDRNIDSVASYKPNISRIIEDGKELTNRVVTFLAPGGNFAAVLTLRYYNVLNGTQKECVISFRPMEETVKLLSRFTSHRPKYTFDDIIGGLTTLSETVRIAKLAAGTTSNILVVGESGTGKELFSQAIHNASNVADGPFIPVNCAAIPNELIESELFGYAEGAFTGARKGGYIGKFEQATGGTLFLDEIGDMPLDLQVKLLRVLQDKVIQRVGSEHMIPISTRVIAATNRDLKQMIKDGQFREELYWRLNVLTIEIPPLRDRKVDIPEYVQFFMEKFARASGKEITEIDPAILKKMVYYSWSGNIRELENAIEHAVLVGQSGTIKINDLPADLIKRMNAEKNIKISDVNENIEHAFRERVESSRKLYREAITQTGGDVIIASKNLGMSRATLYRRLKKYGLTELLSEIKDKDEKELENN